MKHLRRLSIFAASAALSVGLVAGTAAAEKGGSGGNKGGGKSVPPAIVVDDGQFAGTTQARLMVSAESDALLLAVADTDLWVRGYCFQGGEMVWTQSGVASGGTLTFYLGPTPSWSSGSADCVAEYGSWRGMKWVPESSTTFTTHG